MFVLDAVKPVESDTEGISSKIPEHKLEKPDEESTEYDSENFSDVQLQNHTQTESEGNSADEEVDAEVELDEIQSLFSFLGNSFVIS